MKIQKSFLPAILAVSLLICTIAGLSHQKTSVTESIATQASQVLTKTSTQKIEPSESTTPEGEMRAVWVPFMSLSMANQACTQATFEEKFDSILAQCKNFGINTVIVHVRPFGDALYPSAIYPWSHILTGAQGNNPNFDPLSYMIQATHDSGLKFHAWINPLRIQLNGTPSVLCDKNPYFSYKNSADPALRQCVLEVGGDKYYNPAYPQVREMIIRGVTEIVENYPVDGIHFDDYFYPTDDAECDKTAYEEYCAQAGGAGVPLALNEWRKCNINALISGVYSAIKSANPTVQFGISPQVNVSNNLKFGADVFAWGSKKGYVDYLCPQAYVNFEHPVLSYDKAIRQWRDIISCPDVKFYIGLGLYKAGSDSDGGTWKKSDDILMKEIEYAREIGCDGFMLYSFDFLNNQNAMPEVKNAMRVLG